VRLAHIGGRFDETERAAIVGIFVEDWGYDPAYVDQALTVLAAGRRQQDVKEIAQALAEFQIANPDCNPAAMRAEMIGLLRRIAEADGTVDEREDLAIEAVEARRRRRCRCAMGQVRQGRAGENRGIM
jgi:uncharacterized tellurite resistance protein B-like protein